jgi:hypothetical protein
MPNLARFRMPGVKTYGGRAITLILACTESARSVPFDGGRRWLGKMIHVFDETNNDGQPPTGPVFLRSRYRAASSSASMSNDAHTKLSSSTATLTCFQPTVRDNTAKILREESANTAHAPPSPPPIPRVHLSLLSSYSLQSDTSKP